MELFSIRIQRTFQLVSTRKQWVEAFAVWHRIPVQPELSGFRVCKNGWSVQLSLCDSQKLV